MRQSSPTTKSHQKRANAATKRITPPPRRARRLSTRTVRQDESAAQRASSTGSEASPPGQLRLSPSPSAKTPSPSTAQNVPKLLSSRPTANLIAFSGHLRQRPVQGQPGRQDEHAADHGAERGEADRVRVAAERDHDEDDLEALEEDALEADDERRPVEPAPLVRPGAARRLGLLAEEPPPRRAAPSVPRCAGSPCAATAARRSAGAFRRSAAAAARGTSSAAHSRRPR